MSVLGGMPPSVFLRDHWQKRPLLIRQAFPRFKGIIDRDRFMALATRADATSRLVIHHPQRRRPRWERHDGPFGGLDASMLPDSRWTLLVHGLESLVFGAWDILRAFSFIPSARIDDLMVSYATDGGSVGPHDDQYDVFLLQGPGRRRWQVSTKGDRTVDGSAAIKVLENFVPEEEWVLEPGDMLYLPPGVAHHGVAHGSCFTYSIGFLAPTHAELVREFLGYLAEVKAGQVDPDRRYQDPDLKAPKDPLEVGDAMLDQVAAAVGKIEWGKAELSDFLGRFLTRPKARAVFAAPARPMTPGALGRRLRARGRLSLALPSRGLVRRGRLFFNGDAHTPKAATLRWFKTLVTERSLTLPQTVDDQGIGLLHAWYSAGWLSVS